MTLTPAAVEAGRERPIIMTVESVRAILAGTKSQTRRLVKSPNVEDAAIWAFDEKRGMWESGQASGAEGRYGHGELVRCPYGIVGDRLWVKESWQAVHYSVDQETGYTDDVSTPREVPASDDDGWWKPAYAATDLVGENREERGFPWRSPLFMPRWASRITLAVTGVRVERLQAISKDDAIAEGATSRTVERPYGPQLGWSMDWSRVGTMSMWSSGSSHGGRRVKAPLTESDVCLGSPQMAYANAWNAINGKRATWESNPWVWVVAFEVVP